MIEKLSGSSQKVRRAQILLKSDAEGPNWTDRQIAEAFDCRTKTVENIRRRLVEHGFEVTLNGVNRTSPPIAKLLDREQEAQVMRIEFCYTPKHGSWLNIAENELSALTRQCINGHRFGDIETLQVETAAWSCDVNNLQRGVDWQMKVDDARCKLGLSTLKLSPDAARLLEQALYTKKM